jgi:hypothetical protein
VVRVQEVGLQSVSALARGLSIAALTGDGGSGTIRLGIQEGDAMSVTVAGFVKNGVVVPNTPLPEGAFVEVRVVSGPIEVPPELQEEFDAWNRASADALERVERLAREGEDDATR